MAENVKTVALIGAGYMGAEYAKALSNASDFRVVGVMGKSSDRARKLAESYGIPVVAQTVGELFEKTRADAVIVAVPELEARAIALEVFQYRWMVLLEKPPGYRPEIAAELLAVADSLQRQVYVALNRRFYSSSTLVLKELESIEGNRSIIIQDSQDQQMALSIGQPRAVVDAWMYANSIHLVDYARFFCRGAVAKINTVQPFRPYEPCMVEASILFSSGDSATYVGLWQKPGPWAVQVCTAAARFEMRPLEQVGIQRKGERQLSIAPVGEWDQQYKPGIRALVEELGKALRGESHRLPSLTEGVKLMNDIRLMFDLE